MVIAYNFWFENTLTMFLQNLDQYIYFRIDYIYSVLTARDCFHIGDIRIDIWHITTMGNIISAQKKPKVTGSV